MKRISLNDLIMAEEFSLVLSGGGALGIAHLGVLRDMERLGIKPKEIIGTSMGGIIGVSLAIGMSESEIFKQIENFSKVSKWIKISLSGNSVIESKKIDEIFQSIFGSLRLKDTEIPIKIVATNLLTGEKRVFKSTDNILIKDALLCTMAIPGVFEEQKIDDEVFGDGFLCENLGIKETSFDTVLAVDVMGYNSFNHSLPNNFFKSLNVIEMFERSMRILIYNQTQTILDSTDKKILLINPETKGYKTYQFNKAKEIRELGYIE